MSTTRPSDDDFVVHVPPPGEAVCLRRIDDAVDLVFLLQPLEDALVAFSYVSFGYFVPIFVT